MIQNKTVVNICIPIETDEFTKSFIFKNINYRRYVYNDFIEEAEKFKGVNNLYDGFKPLKYKTEYFKMEEEKDIYNEMCVGISEQVSKDIKMSLNRVRDENNKIMYLFETKGIKQTLHKLHFIKFDKYFGSFKVHNKHYVTTAGNVAGRLHVIDKNTVTFRVRGGHGSHFCQTPEILTIRLKEPLYKYKDGNKYPFFIREYKVKGENAVEFWFNELGIKETAFIHRLGKFYIQLSIEGSYFINLDDIKSRQYKAGIDTGIHNPAVLYNGNEFKKYCMPNDVIKKIHYKERKARRLQSIMDKKMNINEVLYSKGLIPSKYTKNYEKVRRKFRKVHNDIVNIKLNWIYNTCKEIATSYQIICVDTFKQPDNNELDLLPNRLKHIVNHSNRFHKMSTFNLVLIHMATKYGCYYVSAPEKTTCTCSKCGHDNGYISLDVRDIECKNKKCRLIIDRDYNAAKNCYNYI